MLPADIPAECTILRSQAKALAAQVLGFKTLVIALPSGHLAVPANPASPPPDRGEMAANATLAYRHLEDASMRLGKVIQAYDGGVSVYDK